MDEIQLTSFLPLDPVRHAKLSAHAQVEPTFRRVTGSTLVRAPTGEVLACYLHPEEPMEALRCALRTVHFAKAPRTAGLVSTSRTFGYAPRVLIRRDYCHRAAMLADAPLADARLMEWAGIATRYFARLLPDAYAVQHARITGEVLPEWYLPGGVFTSGIVNSSNYLAYHRDTGNFPGSWSAMVVMREYLEGGELVVPEWGLSFATADRSLLMFDGARWLHGVSPMRRLDRAKSYRYSVVWYALSGMARCLSCREELARIRVVKTEREQSRLDLAEATRRTAPKRKKDPT